MEVADFFQEYWPCLVIGAGFLLLFIIGAIVVTYCIWKRCCKKSVSKTPPEALGVKNIYERLVKELGDKNLEPIPSDSEGSLKEIPTVMCSEVGGHQLFNICVHKDSISLEYWPCLVIGAGFLLLFIIGAIVVYCIWKRCCKKSVPEIPPEALGVKYISERLVEELRDSDLCPIPSDSEGPLIELLTVMCSDKVDGCQLSSLCVPKDSIPLEELDHKFTDVSGRECSSSVNVTEDLTATLGSGAIKASQHERSFVKWSANFDQFPQETVDKQLLKEELSKREVNEDHYLVKKALDNQEKLYVIIRCLRTSSQTEVCINRDPKDTKDNQDEKRKSGNARSFEVEAAVNDQISYSNKSSTSTAHDRGITLPEGSVIAFEKIELQEYWSNWQQMVEKRQARTQQRQKTKNSKAKQTTKRQKDKTADKDDEQRLVDTSDEEGYENDNPSAATPSPSFGINRSTTAVGINPPTVVAGCSNSKHPQKIGTADITTFGQEEQTPQSIASPQEDNGDATSNTTLGFNVSRASSESSYYSTDEHGNAGGGNNAELTNFTPVPASTSNMKK